MYGGGALLLFLFATASSDDCLPFRGGVELLMGTLPVWRTACFK